VHVFPLASIISGLPNPLVPLARRVFDELIEMEAWHLDFAGLAQESLRSAMAQFPERIATLVMEREGLIDARPKTLEDLGQRHGVTRERIRQLERKFWEALPLCTVATDELAPKQLPFLRALLCHLQEVAGRRIATAGDLETRRVSFLCKCLDLVCGHYVGIGIVIVGMPPGMLYEEKQKDPTHDDFDQTVLALQLQCQRDLGLIAVDARAVASALIAHRRKRLTKAMKAAMSLEHIGRPAHYSEVTSVYNDLWAEDQMIDNNVHAILSREVHGVVWVGVRGTYGLAGWGCQRPTMPWMDAVAEIVKQKQVEGLRAVPFATICAEIGKYRSMVSSASIRMAVVHNPALQYVGNDSYVSVDRETATGTDEVADRLDDVLADLERGHENNE
jgi:hypothetical protein